MRLPRIPWRRYDGGVWHVEGMRNEQIVASAIFYWSVRRIAVSLRPALQHMSPDARALRTMHALTDSPRMP